MYKYTILSILITLLTAVNAVTIRNYSRRDCKGSYGACTNMAQWGCCYRNAGYYASSYFYGLIDSEIGAVCSGDYKEKCKTVKGTGVGNGCVNPDGPTQRLKGSFWFSCIQKDICPTASGEEIAKLKGDSGSGHQVLADKIVFDGHVFDINYHVPENETAKLEELANKEAKYSEVPEELKKFEVTGNAAKEYL